MLRPIFLFSCFIFLALTATSCKSPTETEKDCPEKPKTSSRNFTWRTDTLGKAGSSVGDVWVVNENDIYVGGEFYIKDFSQFNHYNMAHWDGQKWEMSRIYFVRTFDQGIDSSANKIYSIRYFDKNNIVVSDGGEVAVWNGVEWLTKFPPRDYLKGNMIRVYGTSMTNLFYGGTNNQQNIGSLTHFDGENFTNIETGINLPVQDLFGRGDTAFLVASIWEFPVGEIYRLNPINHQLSKYTDSGLGRPVYSIWFTADTLYTGNNDGIAKKSFSDTTWKPIPLPWKQKGALSITGNGWNDIMAVGGFGLIAHFNGENWKEYKSPEVFDLSGGNYYKVKSNQNKFVLIGSMNQRAYVTTLTRK